MPVFLDRGKLKPRRFAATVQKPEMQAMSEAIPKDCIEIALINNMPDLALEQTERQILKLLDASAGELIVRLSLFAMPALLRSDFGQNHLKKLHYRKVDSLPCGKVDALIITGSEPRAKDLKLEPYWHSLTELFDWANNHTVSTICSCLAVHAAVQHFDAIDRHALKRKCFGVFDFKQLADDELLLGVAPRFRMPHSRLNQIAENDLTSAGYKVLSVGQEGVDAFVKARKSFFVFFQGHPEYEPWTLLGEYRRDIARYLSGEQPDYPDMPAGYFKRQSMKVLNAFKTRALDRRQTDLMKCFPIDQLAGSLTNDWHETAVEIYANWLRLIANEKAKRGATMGRYVQ